MVPVVVAGVPNDPAPLPRKRTLLAGGYGSFVGDGVGAGAGALMASSCFLFSAEPATMEAQWAQVKGQAGVGGLVGGLDVVVDMMGDDDGGGGDERWLLFMLPCMLLR